MKNKGMRTPSDWCLGILTTKSLPFFHELNEGLSWQALVFSDRGLGFVLEYPEVVSKRMAEGVENTGKTNVEFFLLSPYVTNMRYGYYNEAKGNWEFTISLETYCRKFSGKNFSQRPDGIQLMFKKGDWEVERFIALNNNFFVEKDNTAKQKLKSQDEKQE